MSLFLTRIRRTFGVPPRAKNESSEHHHNFDALAIPIFIG